MQKLKNCDYYIGLDMGDASVGWAVTDTNYNILKFNGKALWGIRLFDSANTAASTRVFRSGRRRIDRTTWRLKMLQELFAEEIAKVDPGFFMRLEDSRLHLDDKRDKEVYNLFVDKNYTDKDFYQQYPTMYHLRYALATQAGPFDVRLLYLAVQHIAKHRGHFLFDNLDASKVNDFNAVFSEVENYVRDEMGIEDWSCQNIDELAKVLCDVNLGRTTKQKAMQSLLPAQTKQQKAIIQLFSGGKAKLAELFADEELDECEKKSVSFQDDDLNEFEPVLTAALGERYEGLLRFKAIYDWSLLAKILHLDTSKKDKDEQHLLSECKVQVYEDHKRDLAVLKSMLKGKPLYNKIFRQDGDISYEKYAKGIKGRNQIDFCKDLKKQLEGIAEYKKIMQEITSIDDAKTEEERLLFRITNGFAFPKQTTKDNGIIPIQVHLAELKCILDNAEGYLPFLGETDNNGLSVREKIEQIVKFIIPYYVGPLAGTRMSREQGRCWVVRKNEKIYPWNFTEIVNLEESAEKFITNMTAKCTYLVGEDVLPKESLLYSEFMVRNAINNITVDGERLPVDVLEKIFKQLFLAKTSKVTKKTLERFFRQENISFQNIGGIDDKINASMKSYNDFRRIFGEDYIQLHRDEIENIIRWITLFCDEKKMLVTKIKNTYPQISDDEIKAIKKLKYKDWGRLSATLLNSSAIAYEDKAFGELVTIISALRHTNKNFMELLSSYCSYDFIGKIKEFNGSRQSSNGKLTYKDVEELYVSPSVKRSIWQTLTILEEIKKIMGCEPKRIFIEMARSKEESKRTDSRLKKLQDLYKKCREENIDFMPRKDEFNTLKTQLSSKKEDDLRIDKLYLYYTQMGRCMYTGEKIELASLYDNNLYDIDHIYPRSKTKDDSLSNRVLVKKQVNAAKTDTYPLDAAIRTKMHSFWKLLYDKGFIDERKYQRLTRSTQLRDEELAGFISRQLVETRQSTKAVAAILKTAYQNSEVVYVKAGNVSDFRQQFKFVKCREVNDLHHAKDAYLNIVVGNCYHVKFTANPLNFITKNQDNRRYSLKPEIFYKFSIKRDGEIAWLGGEDGTMATVARTMHKNNILFTRQAVEGKGELFDQQPLKAKGGQLPLKAGLSIEKYGGYNSLTTAYFAVVKSEGKKGAVQLSIEAIPLVYAKQGEIAVQKYLTKVVQLCKPEIMLPKIKKYSLFKINGFPMHISGRTGNRMLFYGAGQLCLDEADVDYLKKALKYENDIAENELVIADKNSDDIQKQQAQKNLDYYNQKWRIGRKVNMHIYDMLLAKSGNNLYKNRPASQTTDLQEQREFFEKLSLANQIHVIGEVLKLFKCASASANLKLLDKGNACGVIKVSNNILKFKQCVLINQSPTGVFEQEVDLMKL
ncbi:MAG: type II CRISPR RNA-guided endonuclease Cas9 [Phascolarctobacterium succinatutens]|uniref:type II CRISPR RNA-guided endonuclease Cas9 n=1 Tax=Phascolarctobacterium succinatutens TaxID=626940 RepID=UPI002E7A057B|nr:type II CRISPR RNA-guided endonuclease Cas9 [Phascolarctobacterium succinatutens]MEE0357756.1 type II CRISPR RNA-guided endonuclease Cas9 [Phascolarctobacterium succinatutens]